jgi:hypothetical protein
VWKGALELGVGTPFSSRGGGENTATINIPTRVPTKTHRRDIITLNLYILLWQEELQKLKV